MLIPARAILAAIAGGAAVTSACSAGAGMLAPGASGVPDARSPLPTNAVETLERSNAFGSLDALLAPLAVAYQERLASSELLRRLDTFLSSTEGWLALAGFGLAALLVLRIAARLRPTGSASLRLEFPAAIEGEFEIRLRRRTSRRARSAPARRETRHLRKGVHRETQFDHVAPGAWFLAIDGELRSPRSRAVLAKIHEELEIQIEATGSTAIVHRFPDVEPPSSSASTGIASPPATSASASTEDRRRFVMRRRVSSRRRSPSASMASSSAPGTASSSGRSGSTATSRRSSTWISRRRRASSSRAARRR
ncbi:MAG: hypothetical protein IPK00_07445 [Deltaproteobacteria bacterium]|nr:hypothetical protein [Deltaproteobacteria bacterium]